MKRTILASWFALTLFAVQAKAQEVGIYAGYLNPGKLHLSTVPNGKPATVESVYRGWRRLCGSRTCGTHGLGSNRPPVKR
jgi:hypothetical protein